MGWWTSVWKSCCGSRRARVGLFLDVFNTLNSNTAVNMAGGSGASFEKAGQCRTTNREVRREVRLVTAASR